MSKSHVELISRINKAEYERYLDIMVELIVAMEDFEVIVVY